VCLDFRRDRCYIILHTRVGCLPRCRGVDVYMNSTADPVIWSLPRTCGEVEAVAPLVSRFGELGDEHGRCDLSGGVVRTSFREITKRHEECGSANCLRRCGFRIRSQCQWWHMAFPERREHYGYGALRAVVANSLVAK
jgi:hypothetical protein